MQQPDPSNPQVQKDPKTWTTGNEPATESQKSYLETLGQQTGDHVDDDLSKAQASERIDELQQEREQRESAEGDGHDIAAETDPDLTRDEAA